MKPTFVGIGAQKCASTWLHRILAAHPEVVVAEEKEVDFFSYRFDHGYQWYERQFVNSDSARASGEISPSYFCEASVPERVAAYVPTASILVSFRDPVERALSNHRHEVRAGHIRGPDLTFEAGLANNPMYLEQSRYAKHLKRWLEHFPRERIHAILMDDVREKPQTVAREVFEFLDIDPDVVPENLDKRFNKSHSHRSHALSSVKDTVYAMTRAPGLKWLWNLGARSGARAIYRQVNVMPSEQVIPTPPDELLAAVREQLAPDTRELGDLLGRDLSMWTGN